MLRTAPRLNVVPKESELTPSTRILAELQGAQARRLQVQTRLIQGVGLAASAGLCVCAFALAQWGRVHIALRLFALGAPLALVVGAACAMLWALRSRIRQRRAPHAQALAILAHDAPGLLSAVQSALELSISRSAKGAGPSATLIATHLEKTAQRLFAINLAARWYASHATSIRWGYRGLLLWVALCAVGSVALKQGRTRMLQAVREPAAWRMGEQALVGDVTLRYTYPAYTHAAVRLVEGSDGTLEAVQGTEVDIDIQCDKAIYQAWMCITQPDDMHAAPAARQDAREIEAHHARFTLPLLHDGNYRFILDFGDGERLGDPVLRHMHAVQDAAPQVDMPLPFGDITLRDNAPIAVQWRAQDDFNLRDVKLIVERAGAPPQDIALWSRPADTLVQTQADGAYTWQVASLGLSPGDTVTYYIAAWDTDTHSGPKRGISKARKLTLFSARAHHDDVIAQCRAALDTLVDTLGLELEHPSPPPSDVQAAWQSAQSVIRDAAARTANVDEVLTHLLIELKADTMAQPQIRVAFTNVAEHIRATHTGRAQQIALLDATTFAMRAQRLAPWGRLAQIHVAHLESDIIYLDDLLAVARIDDIKNLAKDLLTDQRHLKELLQQMGHTQDPALRAQMQEGINALRQKMLDVLRKMSEVKQNLPGEYRNMEASSMLRLDDQLGRLDKQLREGDLQSAAEELEQLANMVENMVQSLGEAQKQYGGERYDAMRGQLQAFADKFRALEDEQQSLSQRGDAMLSQYRQKAMAKIAKNKDDFIKKARQLAHDALAAIDEVGADKVLAGRYDYELQQSRQGLLDLDSLLTHQDFAEAHARAPGAEDDIATLSVRLGAQSMLNHSTQGIAAARKSCARAAQKTDALSDMLAQLFDNPDTNLTPQQRQQLEAMGQKQQSLKTQTDSLTKQMQQMAEQMPLFGDDSQKRLEEAGGQMQAAGQKFDEHALADGARHSRQAADALGQLRQKMQQASQQSGQGLPLPLGGAGRGSGQNEDGPGGSFDAERQEEVAIPGAPTQPIGPQFRRDLMEAAKQKAPAYYEDAVRRYYNELIR